MPSKRWAVYDNGRIACASLDEEYARGYAETHGGELVESNQGAEDMISAAESGSYLQDLRHATQNLSEAHQELRRESEPSEDEALEQLRQMFPQEEDGARRQARARREAWQKMHLPQPGETWLNRLGKHTARQSAQRQREANNE
jgi:hypothetical protein